MRTAARRRRGDAPAAIPSRSVRIACLRWSRRVRSRISTPSRWSISCWITRASRPGRLDSERRAGLVAGAHPHVDRPLDLDADAGEREAALLHRLELVAPALELRVDEHGERRVGLDAVDEHAVHHAELGGGEADPERVVHQLAHALDLVGERRVERSTGQRAAAQHRVAVLADVPQRGVAARAVSGSRRCASSSSRTSTVLFGHRSVEFSDPPIADRRPRRTPRRAMPGRARRLDGGRGGGDRRLALGGLDDDLAALAPAQPEQRRRAEDLGRLPDARGDRLGDAAPPAARTGSAASAEQITRIRSANGG